MSGLIRYDAMVLAIAECHRIDEVVAVRNRAEALRHYHRQAGNVEAERRVAQIRLRAERRVGEILKEMKEAGERDAGAGGDRKSRFRLGTVKLADLGISKKESHLWQRLAEIPEAEFESSMASSRAVTTYELLRERVIKEAEWQGMPPCGQEDQGPLKRLIVNFATEDDLDAFSKDIGQKITMQTRSIWYPAAKIDHVADKRWVGRDSEISDLQDSV